MKRTRTMVLAGLVTALAVMGPSPAAGAPSHGGGGFSLAPPVETGFALQSPTVLTSLRIGSGSTPDVTVGADDLFVEGSLEVDGPTRLDGALDLNSTLNVSGAVTVSATAEIFVPAGEFLGNAGTPARAAIGSANAQGWALDADSDESISAMFKVPDGFSAANATCYVGWSSTDTGGADAVFDVITVPTAVGEDSGLAGNTDSVTGTDSTTADDLNEDSVTVAASTEWAADDIVYLTINRDADNVADTLTTDASVQYFRCTLTVTDVQ